MLVRESSLGWLFEGHVVEIVCEKVNTIKTICENMYIVVELLSTVDGH